MSKKRNTAKHIGITRQDENLCGRERTRGKRPEPRTGSPLRLKKKKKRGVETKSRACPSWREKVRTWRINRKAEEVGKNDPRVVLPKGQEDAEHQNQVLGWAEGIKKKSGHENSEACPKRKNQIEEVHLAQNACPSDEEPKTVDETNQRNDVRKVELGRRKADEKS